MKIIFLDIDGVLNHQGMTDEDWTKYGTCGGSIDPQSVKVLNDFTDETGAKIVVSSTWRLDGLDRVRKALEEAGVMAGIIDITPRFTHPGYVRGNEIKCWLDAKTYVDSYVIFDDDSDMLFSQRFNFINVDPYVGLTYRNTFRARQIFEGLSLIC